uniref:Macrophage mannose receptor 1-like isoform X1 n=1 Tax=Saccoglossus kowalevskii TaxID=10224 RepID=A0ABM0MSZ9_SACKO|nr:PREDICTED: macrophage mannose receptor 1-like isoform X1 [Saccoglossus kowalevskii]
MKIINITLFVLVSCVFSTHAYTISNHVAVEYHIVAGSYTWDEAIAECASLGGTLARIPDKRTDDFITQYIRDSGLGDQVDTGFWIGLNDRNEEDNFKWINGGEVCYTNWGEGEPDNNTNKNPQGQDCGQLRKQQTLNGMMNIALVLISERRVSFVKYKLAAVLNAQNHEYNRRIVVVRWPWAYIFFVDLISVFAC